MSVGPSRIEHMFDTVTASPTTPAGSAAAVLATAVTHRAAADAAEAQLLVTAGEWADLHPPESIHDAATFPAPRGGEQEERIAGPGCPLVAEFCIPELAAALGMSTLAGKRLVGHALELRHRLPQLWAAVQTGRVQAWRARRVAEATIHADLTVAGAGFVDRMVTPYAATLTTAQLDRVIAEALRRFTTPDPDGPDVTTTRARPTPGTCRSRTRSPPTAATPCSAGSSTPPMPATSRPRSPPAPTSSPSTAVRNPSTCDGRWPWPTSPAPRPPSTSPPREEGPAVSRLRPPGGLHTSTPGSTRGDPGSRQRG